MSGLLALVGAGEFLPTMRDIDRLLLAGAAARPPRVAVVPTAAAPEGPAVVDRWLGLADAHFRALGALPTGVALGARADADDPAALALLADAALIYFSGGDPAYLATALVDTPALAAARAALERGAALAGCSAGAMALGEVTLDFRASRVGPVRWLRGWGVVPGVTVLPHFDRSRQRRPGWIVEVAAATPPGITLVGIDEHTALVGTAGAFTVHGSGTVTVFTGDGPRVYGAGEQVALAGTPGA